MKRQLLRPITGEEIETYKRDGVVCLRGILDLSCVRDLEAAIADLMATPPASAVSLTNLGLLADRPEDISGFVAGDLWRNSTEEWGNEGYMRGTVLLDERVAEIDKEKRGHFWSITGSWRQDERVRELATRSPLPEIAAQLMESRRVFLCGDGDQILVKPPLTREKTAWHQDLGYDHLAGSQRIAIRVPCDPETLETGTVRYLRGSHRDGTEYKVNYFISNMTSPDDPAAALPDIDGHEAEFDLVHFDVEPGDLVVHHIGTVHGAGGNASPSQQRRAITIRYCGDDAVYYPRPLAPPVNTPPKIKKGASVAGDPDIFPPVYP